MDKLIKRKRSIFNKNNELFEIKTFLKRFRKIFAQKRKNRNLRKKKLLGERLRLLLKMKNKMKLNKRILNYRVK